MSNAYSIDKDLKEIAKMGDQLETYIPSDELYMSVGGGLFGSGNMPQLTTGSFLLRMRRLNQLRDEMTGVQQATLDKAIAQYSEVTEEWAVHHEKKMVKEALSRLKAMNEFFRECRESMRTCANAYPVEAQRRTIVQELIIAMNDANMDMQEVITQSHQTDGELRRWITAGEFIWSDMLQIAYPRETFWWLYGRPDAGE